MTGAADQTYRVVKFTAENFQKLKLVEITPKGNVVQLSGPNAAGKSSVLQAIWATLGGKDAVPEKPVRTGTDKAQVTIDLGGLIVTRRFTGAGGTSIVVESKDGQRFASPQTVLDELLGRFTFDPLAFTRLKPSEQLDELKRLVQVDFAFEQCEGLNQRDYERRTQVNRDAKALRAQADGVIVPEGTPEQLVDLSALLDQLEQAGTHNASIETRKGKRQAVAEEIKRLDARAASTRAQADELRRQVEALETEAQRLEEQALAEQERLAKAPPLPDPVDVSHLRQQVEQARTTNAHVERLQRKHELVKNAGALEAQAINLTEAIKARDQAREQAIASANMPVPGLGFGAGEVLYNGLPLVQASQAEQIRVSMAIAASANPRIRVLHIRDGSLLDSKSLALVAEFAQERDLQVWVEMVDESRSVGVVLEDGQVVGDHQHEPKPTSTKRAAKARAEPAPALTGKDDL